MTPAALPVKTTTLVGREHECDAVCKLLRGGVTRLVTLSGPGGVGKTRLASVVGESLAGTTIFESVRFIPLATCREAEQAASLIAQDLGAMSSPGARPLDAVLDALRARRVLLILDNLEQIVGGAPLVSALLTGLPDVTLLVTSRAVLRVYGERVLTVRPLEVPDEALARAAPERALASPAVRLFLERAREAQADFSLLPADVLSVAQICRHLDGLPLAIELAAARVRLMAPQAMLARLKRRLPLLTVGAIDAPERHQTLRAAIAWSVDLLPPPELAVFRMASVFSGGFSLEAAETVFASAAASVVDVLQSLVDKSLLQRAGSPDGGPREPRFAMLQTVRDFASEALAHAPEAAIAPHRHAAYFLALAEDAEPHLNGPAQTTWLARLDREHENLRAALRWCIDARQTSLGLRLASAMRLFWDTRGGIAEGRRVLEALLQQAVQDAPGIPAAPTAAGGSPQPHQVEPRIHAKALYVAGVLADAQADYPGARAAFQRALAIQRHLGNDAGIANTLNNLGVVATRLEDFAGAQALYEESLEIWRRLGQDRAAALALVNLGAVAESQGRTTAARTGFTEALTTFEALADQRGIALCHARLADIALAAADYEAARVHQRHRLELLERIGDQRGVAAALADHARVSLAAGEDPRPFVRRCVPIFAALGDRRGLAGALETLALHAASGGNGPLSLRLAGAAARLRHEAGVPLAPTEQTQLEERLAIALDSLDEVSQQALWDEGAALTVDAAVQVALASAADTTSPPTRVSIGAVTHTIDVPARVGAPPAEEVSLRLSPREREVAALVARGLTNPQIAATLVISTKTAANHVEHILTKLGFHSRAQVAAWAAQNGIWCAPSHEDGEHWAEANTRRGGAPTPRRTPTAAR